MSICLKPDSQSYIYQHQFQAFCWPVSTIECFRKTLFQETQKLNQPRLLLGGFSLCLSWKGVFFLLKNPGLQLKSKYYGINILFVADVVTHFIQKPALCVNLSVSVDLSVWGISNKGRSECFKGSSKSKVHLEIVRNQFKSVSFLWLQEVGRGVWRTMKET